MSNPVSASGYLRRGLDLSFRMNLVQNASTVLFTCADVTDADVK
jgi:hypothetical protein